MRGCRLGVVMGLGTGEIILIVLVVVLVFGGSKLPQLGDGLGRAIGSFKRALGGISDSKAPPDKAERAAPAEGETQETGKPGDKTPPG